MTEADRRSRSPAGLARQRGGAPSPQEAALAAEAYENLAAVASGFAPAELLAPAPPFATFTGMARGLGLLPLPRDAPLSTVGGDPAAIGADAVASSAPNTVQQRQQQPLAAQQLLRESPALAGRSSRHEECSQAHVCGLARLILQSPALFMLARPYVETRLGAAGRLLSGAVRRSGVSKLWVLQATVAQLHSSARGAVVWRRRRRCWQAPRRCTAQSRPYRCF